MNELAFLNETSPIVPLEQTSSGKFLDFAYLDHKSGYSLTVSSHPVGEPPYEIFWLACRASARQLIGVTTKNRCYSGGASDTQFAEMQKKAVDDKNYQMGFTHLIILNGSLLTLEAFNVQQAYFKKLFIGGQYQHGKKIILKIKDHKINTKMGNSGREYLNPNAFKQFDVVTVTDADKERVSEILKANRQAIENFMNM